MTTTSAPVQAAAASSSVSMGPGAAALSPSTVVSGPPGSPPRKTSRSCQARDTRLVSIVIAQSPPPTRRSAVGATR